MINLIFDTETTGFVQFSNPWEHPDQPYIVQIAAKLVEGDRLYAAFQAIVSGGIPSEPGALKTHGITEELRSKVGLAPWRVSAVLGAMIRKADMLVAHNLKFDLILIGALLHRNGEYETLASLKTKKRFCTMLALTPVMKLPNPRGGYKWPKLEEAYVKYIDATGIKGAHDAMADAIACEKIFNVCKEMDLVPEGGEL